MIFYVSNSAIISKGLKPQGLKPPIPNSLMPELKLRPTNHGIGFLKRSSYTILPPTCGLRVMMFRGQMIGLFVRGEASLLDVAAIFGRRA